VRKKKIGERRRKRRKGRMDARGGKERKMARRATSGKGDDANRDDAKASAERLADDSGAASWRRRRRDTKESGARKRERTDGGSCYGEQRQTNGARDRRGKLRATGTITQSQRAAGGQVALTKGVKFGVLGYVQVANLVRANSQARVSTASPDLDVSRVQNAGSTRAPAWVLTLHFMGNSFKEPTSQ
jgi:hypothetical protein